MANCWASCLGNCSDEQSREHIVSKSLFAMPAVAVYGLPWCKEEEKTVGIESLTAKILCRTHNSALSDLDAEAGQAFRALHDQSELAALRAKLAKRSRVRPKYFKVDANKLARWCLKTLINVSYQGDLLISPEADSRGVPPSTLVRVTFGFAPWPAGAGLYLAGQVGTTLNISESLQVATVLNRSGEVLQGALITFRGFRFALSLMPGRVEQIPLDADLPSEWVGQQLFQPMPRIRTLHHDGFLSTALDFVYR
jgi:hypothetical protein